MDPDTAPSTRVAPGLKHQPMARKFPVRLTVFIFSAIYTLIATPLNIETSIVQEVLVLAGIMLGVDTYRPTGQVAA